MLNSKVLSCFSGDMMSIRSFFLFLIRNENITSEEMQNKKPFEIILHAERVTSLQSWKGNHK